MKTFLVQTGPEDYTRLLELQRGWVAAVAQEKLDPLIWIGQHKPVITLGLRGGDNDLNMDRANLAARGVDLLEIERGGLATVHGPGQLVAYPLIPLRRAGIGIRELVNRLEEVMILTLAELGIKAGRSPVNPGVWVGPDKIGFLGLAVRRGVSLHGLCLNIDPDLGLFDLITPCGLTGVRVVSAAQVLGRPVDLNQTQTILSRFLCDQLGCRPAVINLDEAEALLAQTETEKT